MAVGYPTTKADIDSRAGSLAVNVHNTFTEIRNMQLWLLATANPELEALGYTPTDVARLKGAFTDLTKLADIYEGLATQTPAYDFRTFAKFLTGVA